MGVRPWAMCNCHVVTRAARNLQVVLATSVPAAAGPRHNTLHLRCNVRHAACRFPAGTPFLAAVSCCLEHFKHPASTTKPSRPRTTRWLTDSLKAHGVKLPRTLSRCFSRSALYRGLTTHRPLPLSVLLALSNDGQRPASSGICCKTASVSCAE